MIKATVKFSLIMAAYNTEKYIAEAIQSVQGQSYSDWELIIVDDASVDKTAKIAKEFLSDNRIRFFSMKENMGCGGAKGFGIDMAKGKLIGIIDSDDVLTPNALDKIVEIYSTTSYDVVHTSHFECDSRLKNCKKIKWVKRISANDSDIFQARISAFLTFKSKIYWQTEGMDDEQISAEDKDLIYKLEEVGDIYFLDEPLYYYRRHKDETTFGRKTWLGAAYCTLSKYKAYKRRIKKKYPYNFSPNQLNEVLFTGAIKFYIGGNPKYAKKLWSLADRKNVNIRLFMSVGKSLLQEIKHQIYLYLKK